MAKLCSTLETLWTVARQAPLSIGLSRQEYWSELPFPTPGDLPDPMKLIYIPCSHKVTSYKGT